MDIRKAKSQLFRNIVNIPGWSTKRKLIVIESDDWGSVRMPSLDVFNKLERNGLDLRSADAERFNLNDTLASKNDFEGLFDVLTSVKDKNNKNAVFTPVCIMANPNFEKIKEADYKAYFYEPFTETLKRNNGCEKSLESWKEGIEKDLFVPQLHGRDHLNVSDWLRDLNSGNVKTKLAFDEGLWGFVPDSFPKVDYQAAFLLNHKEDLEYHSQQIKEGIKLFEDILGYKADYFVPPNGQFNNELNSVLFSSGIKFRSASKVQIEPIGNGENRKVYHYHGQKHKSGITYMTRNCLFEPGQHGRDWVDSCLFDIKMAFRWKKPAIISTHRVNFVGGLSTENRDNGLKQLSELLSGIIKYWPDAEFITTAQLGKIMSASN
ncbi:hypothetical protein [Saccharicrinis sp. 156]|uniref:hypothetical protein n=1 Tax=Saccharicrinis sp. 156 TaxID=3417574 RepID=UPI003D3474AD